MSNPIVINHVPVSINADGLYRLNDIHAGSPVADQDHKKPSEWARKGGAEIIAAARAQSGQGRFGTKSTTYDDTSQSPSEGFGTESSTYVVVKGGNAPGTYASKDLVYAYAMWLSPEFMLHVIRVFDAVVTQASQRVPTSFAEALQLAADQQRLIESQAAQIEHLAPMAQLGSAVSGRDYMTLRDWISELKNERSEVKEKRVHQFLIERGFLYRNPMRRLRAYAQHDHLFSLKEICCADGQYRSTLVITGAGMARLYDVVLNDAVDGAPKRLLQVV